MRVGCSIVLVVVAAASTCAVESSASSNSSGDCSFACTDVYQPVCGSDGATYSNKCFLGLAACNNTSDITQVSDGECATTVLPSTTSSTEVSTNSSGSAGCPEACSKIYEPVCGSDGLIYSNDCVLGVAQCKSGGLITKVSGGECSASSSSSVSPSGSAGCPDACLDVYDPVTDENGVQYSNKCYLRMTQCKGETGSTSALESPASSIDDRSSCDNRACTMDYTPVCGSDGVTYSNSCMLDLAKCKNSSITQASEGECKRN